jgi:hypothetical protein
MGWAAVDRKSGGVAPHSKLDGGDEGAVWVDVAVGHARSVEGVAGGPVFVEEDEAAGAFASTGEELDDGLGGARGIGAGGTKEIASSFGKDDFHDGLTETGGRDRAGFAIGVTAAADERRIADASGELAAGAAGRSGGEEAALVIERDGADGALLVPTMMFCSMGVFAAALPRFAFGGGDEFFGIAKRDALAEGELLGTFRDEHHVRAFFEDGARGLDGILDAVKTGDGASAESGSVHNDSVAFDVAVEIEVRTVARVENGIVFENGDGRFDGVESVAAVEENVVAGMKGTETTRFASVDGIVGDVPGTAMDYEGGLHGKEEDSRYRRSDIRGGTCDQELRRDFSLRSK